MFASMLLLATLSPVTPSDAALAVTPHASAPLQLVAADDDDDEDEDEAPRKKPKKKAATHRKHAADDDEEGGEGGEDMEQKGSPAMPAALAGAGAGAGAFLCGALPGCIFGSCVCLTFPGLPVILGATAGGAAAGAAIGDVFGGEGVNVKALALSAGLGAAAALVGGLLAIVVAIPAGIFNAYVVFSNATSLQLYNLAAVFATGAAVLVVLSITAAAAGGAAAGGYVLGSRME